MDVMRTEEQNSRWKWVVAILIILGIIYIASQWQSNNRTFQVDRITKAKQACRWDGKQQNWDTKAMATCNRLGTADYTDSTEHYYNMYNAKIEYGL